MTAGAIRSQSLRVFSTAPRLKKNTSGLFELGGIWCIGQIILLYKLYGFRIIDIETVE